MKLWTLPLAFLFLSCQPNGSVKDAGPEAASLSVVPEAAAPVITIEDGGSWSLHFSPNGGCEQVVADFIGTAQVSVHLLAYGFTSEKIANALITKKAMGRTADGGILDVQVVLDKSDKTAKGSMASMLKNGNIPVFIDSKHAIMHNKVVVVDGVAFETGSFNFTNAAEHSNAENCLIEHDAMKAKLYDDNWGLHKGHSDPLPFPN